MSETSGGCVYDGVPLPGVTAHVGERIALTGPVVARGYRLRPDLTAASFTGATFTTGDLGRWDGRPARRCSGRADDVVVTGGEKVAPAAVEAALAEHPAVAEAAVVGVPDAEWGARVVALRRAAARRDPHPGRGPRPRGRPARPGGGAARAAGARRPAAAALRQAGPRRATLSGVTTTDSRPVTDPASAGRDHRRAVARGARPRTLPAAVSPRSLVGTGAAAALERFRPGRALLALVVALALQVGVNYANDYSDGVRGTDAHRGLGGPGPLRLVGSGVAARPRSRRAAFACFGVAAVAGLAARPAHDALAGRRSAPS